MEKEQRMSEEWTDETENHKNSPLYRQIEEQILKMIQEQDLKPGALIPTEYELEKMFSVSRTTIRTAIASLQQKGYIIKQQGRGTFVAQNSYETCVAVLQSYTEDAKKNGSEIKSVLISAELIYPTEELMDKLDHTDKTVLRIQRLRYVDGKPSILTTSYLPKRVEERFDWENIDFTTASLYAELEKAGIELDTGEEVIDICQAGIYEASLLQVKEGFPLARNRRYVYDKQKRLVEYSYNLTRGDCYSLHVALKKQIGL